jgi:hypothetical protein
MPAVPTNPLCEQILRAIDAPAVERHTPTPRYSASILGFCDRRTYYKVLGTPMVEANDLGSACRKACGNVCEDIVLTRLAQELPRVIRQQTFTDIIITPQEVRDVLHETPNFERDLRCSVKVDALVPYDPDPRFDVLIECKTGGADFLLRAPPDYYLMQAGCYWRSFWTRWVMFLLLDRVNFGRRLVALEDPEKAWRMALTTINRVERYINVEKAPPPTSPKAHQKACRSCGYFHLCFRRT